MTFQSTCVSPAVDESALVFNEVLSLWFLPSDNETAVYTLMPMVMADQHRLASRSSVTCWVRARLEVPLVFSKVGVGAAPQLQV